MNKLRKLLNFRAYNDLYKYTENHRLNILFIVLINVTFVFLGLSNVLVSKGLIDSAVAGNMISARNYGILFASSLIIQLIFQGISSIQITKTRETLKNKLQLNILDSLYDKKWQYFNLYKSGDIQTRVYNDISDVIDIWINVVPVFVALITQFVSSFVVLYYFDSFLAILAFAVSPVALTISWFIGNKTKKLQHLIQKQDSTLRSYIYESLQNIIILKTFKYKNTCIQTTAEQQNIKYNYTLQKNWIGVASSFFLGFGYSIGFFLAFVFGSYRLSQSTISFGVFTSFLQLVGQIQAPIEGMTKLIPQIITALASVERIRELQDLPDDIFTIDGISPTWQPSEIIFKEVNFEYEKGKTILENINLSVVYGEKIAIIGTSGEGKTTLIHLLLSLIEPKSGTIEMKYSNGKYGIFTADTRCYFSYVPQNNSLFSGTILSNLLVANKDASSEDISKALITSCSSDFVYELSSGIHSVIGERGIGLSQGQIQRIAIARALLHNVPFIIFDEATSALDQDTENQLIQNLKKYYPKTTIIAVTHRDSVFKICDRVYKIEGHKMHQIDNTIPKEAV